MPPLGIKLLYCSTSKPILYITNELLDIHGLYKRFFKPYKYSAVLSSEIISTTQVDIINGIWSMGYGPILGGHTSSPFWHQPQL